MRGLLILFGESFRLGGQNIRNRGSPESYDAQMKAAQSQVAWIERLRMKGIEMDVGISSYTTSYQDQLASVYPNLVFSLFHPDLLGQNGLIQHALNHTRSEQFDYDFVFYMRIDLLLKEPFDHINLNTWQTIRFFSICWEKWSHIGKDPRVNDMMMYIPRAYFKYLRSIELSHYSWPKLMELGLTYDDMDMMWDTYHDSNSEIDYNPYYSIVNRPECLTQHSKKRFNKYDQ